MWNPLRKMPMKSMTSVWCLYWKLWVDFTNYSVFSIVEFKQVMPPGNGIFILLFFILVFLSSISHYSKIWQVVICSFLYKRCIGFGILFQRKIIHQHIPPPPSLLYGEGRGLRLRPIFQKGGLGRISIFRGGDFLQGGCSFYIRNKLKSQIFSDRKCLSAKMFFSVTTKNLTGKF